jgi:hypothetical protein
MLEFLRGKLSDRKLRLFACGCCRQIWNQLGEEYREVVKHAELLADGRALALPVNLDWYDELGGAAYATMLSNAHEAALRVANYSADAMGIQAAFEQAFDEYMPRILSARRAQTALFLDLVGPLPFRSFTLPEGCLAWNDATVVKIAQAMYSDGALDRMPILADALEDAGCDNADILNHCRQPGEHVRGCWVIDLLLGKE